MLPAANDRRDDPAPVESDLFSVNSIPLCASCAPHVPRRDEQQEPRRLHIVVNDAKDWASLPALPIQLHLAWASPEPENVVSLVDRRCLTYLDHGVYDVFRDFQEISSAAIALEKAGIYLIGQLVQLRERDLQILRGVSSEATRDMAVILKQLGLGFNMHLPAWNRQARMPLAV